MSLPSRIKNVDGRISPTMTNKSALLTYLSVGDLPSWQFRGDVLFSGHLLYFKHFLCSAQRNQSRRRVETVRSVHATKLGADETAGR
jgi:hypothetical protein